jgi:hypothetical protein
LGAFFICRVGLTGILLFYFCSPERGYYCLKTLGPATAGLCLKLCFVRGSNLSLVKFAFFCLPETYPSVKTLSSPRFAGGRTKIAVNEAIY